MKKTKKNVALAFIGMILSLSALQGVHLSQAQSGKHTYISWGCGKVAEHAWDEGEEALAAGWALVGVYAGYAGGALLSTTGWTGVGIVGAGVLGL